MWDTENPPQSRAWGGSARRQRVAASSSRTVATADGSWANRPRKSPSRRTSCRHWCCPDATYRDMACEALNDTARLATVALNEAVGGVTGVAPAPADMTRDVTLRPT